MSMNLSPGRLGWHAAYFSCLDFGTHDPLSEPENRRNLRLWECAGKEKPPMLEAWAMLYRCSLQTSRTQPAQVASCTPSYG
jgi:hypothetical protein